MLVGSVKGSTDVGTAGRRAGVGTMLGAPVRHSSHRRTSCPGTSDTFDWL